MKELKSRLGRLCGLINVMSANILCPDKKPDDPQTAESIINKYIGRRAICMRAKSIRPFAGFFKRVPREVRDLIWRYAVMPAYFNELRDRPIWVRRPTYLMFPGTPMPPDLQYRHPPPDLQLLWTTKQIYKEVSHTLYSMNGFAFWHQSCKKYYSILRKRLGSLTSLHLQMLRIFSDRSVLPAWY